MGQTTGPPRPARGISALVLCLVAGAFPAGCSYEKPTVELANIGVTGIDFQKLDLLFDLKVHNPNSFQISISSLDYQVAAGGERVAGGALPRPIPPLGAKKTTNLRAPVELHYAGLLPVVKKLGARQALPFEFSGEAAFNILGLTVPVPFRHEGRIPALRAPSWHLRQVRLLGQGDPGLELVFEVDNPNDFPLPLLQLKGHLRYGEQTLLEVNQTGLESAPAGRPAELTVPIRINAAGVLEAVGDAISRGGSIRFDGKLHLGVPPSLKEMLLGQEQGDD